MSVVLVTDMHKLMCHAGSLQRMDMASFLIRVIVQIDSLQCWNPETNTAGLIQLSVVHCNVENTPLWPVCMHPLACSACWAF